MIQSFRKDRFLFLLPRIMEYINSLDGEKEYEIEVRPIKKKRSLDANAYAWVLLDKLAAKTGIKKEDIYRDLIKNIGGNSETVCVRDPAVDKIVSCWGHNGIGWVAEKTESKISGCTNVILYYGSSVYDTAQMHRLIELIIQECKEQGIETMTPAEIAMLEEQWNG